jgi:uncharacterized membrane protein YvbJ
MKYCEHCGNQIENDNAIVCPTCGEPTKSYNQQSDKNIIINNSASAASSPGPTKQKKHYNFLLDLILILCTGGLWIIWMLIRPKYEY